jgi:hypothetical protein
MCLPVRKDETQGRRGRLSRHLERSGGDDVRTDARDGERQASGIGAPSDEVRTRAESRRNSPHGEWGRV